MNNFLFGVATASHQNEGYNVYNNWGNWEELQNLERSGIACNSWNNYKDDIKSIKKIGCNSYRFSIEWSRIMPYENQIDYNAIQKYKDMIIYSKKHNIEPIVTLHHFTRPMWFDFKYEGLHSEIFLEKFNQFILLVIEHLCPYINYLITFNEPFLECLNGYIRGTRPPGYNMDFSNMYLALKNILDAHAFTYYEVKKKYPNILISFSKNLVKFKKKHKYDYLRKHIENNIDNLFNWSLLDAVFTGNFEFGISFFGITKKWKNHNEFWKGTIDFIAVNHYNVGYIEIKYRKHNPIDVILFNPKKECIKNALDWELDPNSMTDILYEVCNRYSYFPIMITENGSCEINNTNNSCQKFILDNHFSNLMQFNNINKNIIGYMWWTLQDNFEWDDGYKPKFGLYTRDLITNNNIGKTLKPIGEYYKKLIKKYSNNI